jgi:tRNA (mo5U34)-methyltransferase
MSDGRPSQGGSGQPAARSFAEPEVREIRRRVMSFERWHYQFDLAGVTTPIWYPGCVNRHAQRKRHFFDPLVRFCGGSLRGKRVLDLGCNAGFWALAAVEAGCDYVRGIDGRAMHVAQANLVFDVKGVERERYDFVEGNVFEVAWGDGFDIVLCLGLLYHVNRPVELLERIARANTDLLVVDTAIVPGDESALYMLREDVEDPRSAVRSGLVLVPTASAVIEMLRSCGYHGVMLHPSFDDYTAADDFRDGKRRAFVCAKRAPLDGFEGIVEAGFAPATTA